MTASLYSKMAKIILNIIREAVEKGLNATKPVQLLLNGSTIQGDLAAPQRNVLVSFAQPAITAETVLWVNPANRLIFKSNPSTKVWQQIFEFADMFSAYNVIGGGSDGGIGGNAAGQPVQTIAELQAINTSTLADKTLMYVENERAIYAYDKDSIDSGAGVIVPASGVGRWLLVTNSSGSILNLDGGLFN